MRPFVCLSASGREHISETARPIFTKFFLHVFMHSRGSIIRRQRYDSFVTLCTSGSMDDVMFSRNDMNR